MIRPWMRSETWLLAAVHVGLGCSPLVLFPLVAPAAGLRHWLVA